MRNDYVLKDLPGKLGVVNNEYCGMKASSLQVYNSELYDRCLFGIMESMCERWIYIEENMWNKR